MIWRIRDRRTFVELRRRGSRIRQGPIIVTYLPAADGTPPRVAYALPRKVGHAPARNRLRRRLQALMVEHSRAGSLPGGAYLISATAAATSLSHAELGVVLAQALASLGATA